jgi:hypothetical protein
MMNCERAPWATAVAVAGGLLDPKHWLRGSVMVRVPLRRRDRFGSPAAIFSAVIHGPGTTREGVLGVWALSPIDKSISSLNAVAREFSDWPLLRGRAGHTAPAFEIMTTYPEVMAAELGAMSVDRELAIRA